MPTIPQILTKVFPKLRAIEENPDVQIIRIGVPVTSNPFENQNNEVFDKSITVPCVYSEQPEIVTSVSNITTQQQLYLYIQKSDVEAKATEDAVWESGVLDLKDKFVFNGQRYRPVEVQLLFGLWKIKVNKE